MQDIRELVLLLQQRNVHPFKGVAENSKLVQFYDGLAKGKFLTDEAAVLALYGEGVESSKYRKLKSDLRERLLEAVLELDTNEKLYSDYQKAYYQCHKEWAIVRILTGQNANAAALSVALRLLRQSEKYDFTLLAMDVASYLRTQYGLRESNNVKFKEANELFEKHRAIYDAENKAETLYTDLVARYVNTRSEQMDVAAQATAYWGEVSPLMEHHHTYKLQLYGYLIGVLSCTTSGDYPLALSRCEQAVAYFKKRPYEARVPLQIFYYEQLLCNLQLRQFEAGKTAAEYCLKTMQEGTFNWFKYRELYFQLSMYTGEYQQAATLLRDTLNNPRYEFLPENVKELWRIHEAYIHYLVLVGEATQVGRQTFKLAKFLNETPIFSKDKGGINISILIVRFLLLFQERRYPQLLDEMDAMEQYCYRHLRQEHTQRSLYFIKMLLSVPQSGFDAAQAVAKAARYISKLEEHPFSVSSQSHEVEVIPYEVVWDTVIQSLKSRAAKSAA